MSLPLFDQPPPRVTMSPSAIEARRSGHRRARSQHGQCARYLAALRAHGPASDHRIAAILGWGLNVVNARRNDCRDEVEAKGRERIDYGSGRPTSRTLWSVKEPA
jgi:hypothetical protein